MTLDTLLILIPIALVFVAIAVKLLFWAINSGQYDDLDTEAHRILFDDEKSSSNSKTVGDTESSVTENKEIEKTDSESKD